MSLNQEMGDVKRGVAEGTIPRQCSTSELSKFPERKSVTEITKAVDFHHVRAIPAALTPIGDGGIADPTVGE
jgi:hypothetical protein